MTFLAPNYISPLRCYTASVFFIVLLSMVAATCEWSFAQTISAFDQFVSSGRKAFADGKLDDGMIAALAAIKENDQRFEGYALAALLLEKQAKTSEALNYVEKALTRAPEAKRVQLEQIRERLRPTSPASNSTAEQSVTEKFSGETRRKYDALMLIIEDADKAKESQDRTRLLREFMVKSAEFLEMRPDYTNIWVIRGASAVEVDYPLEGWLVGRRLKEYGLEKSDQSAIRKVFAALERKGWLGNEPNVRNFSKWTIDQVRASADAGDTEAQFGMGNWYENEMSGVARSLVDAAKWYRKAANAGDVRAQHYLGLCYYKGAGVPQEYAEAVKWVRKAADAGSAEAQKNLGILYYKGEAMPQDYIEAAKWFRKAANAGNAVAQSCLGMCYHNGEGVQQDYTEAAKWYRKAADQNNANAENFLGLLYENGYGIEKDGVAAIKWYKRAAQHGNDPAKERLRNIENAK
jgi:TPR repeat protein